jgi:hypothetical protein
MTSLQWSVNGCRCPQTSRAALGCLVKWSPVAPTCDNSKGGRSSVRHEDGLSVPDPGQGIRFGDQLKFAGPDQDPVPSRGTGMRMGRSSSGANRRRRGDVTPPLRNSSRRGYPSRRPWRAAHNGNPPFVSHRRHHRCGVVALRLEIGGPPQARMGRIGAGARARARCQCGGKDSSSSRTLCTPLWRSHHIR